MAVSEGVVESIYDLTCEGTLSHDFGLRDQINRASGSAMDNIAEGFDGGSLGEFIRFLGYSQRSCTEIQSQLYRAFDRKHITQADFDRFYELASHAHAKVGGLIRYLKDRQK